jgi:hypothetical protein
MKNNNLVMCIGIKNIRQKGLCQGLPLIHLAWYYLKNLDLVVTYMPFANLVHTQGLPCANVSCCITTN